VQKKDSVQFDFYDGDRLIRTLKYKTPKKAGFHKIYWGMDEKGPDRPARKISTNKRERGGANVRPGTYKVKISFGETSDSTNVTVKTDPRLNVSLASVNDVYEHSKKLDGYTQKAADAVKQLVESKNLANKYAKEMKTLDKDNYKDQIKASKEIVKAIDSVVAVYIGKEDKRQGITRNPEINVMQRIGNASFYVATRKSGLTKTEKDLITYAKTALQEALVKTNTFYNQKWSAYRKTIEALDLSPFKEAETFTID